MTPTFGSSAHLKISAVIITEAAHGMMSAHRATRRPGNLWLNSWARPSEISMVTATTTTTQTTVRSRTRDEVGLVEEVAVVGGAVVAGDEAFAADVLERRLHHDHDRPEHDHADERDGGAEPQQRRQAAEGGHRDHPLGARAARDPARGTPGPARHRSAGHYASAGRRGGDLLQLRQLRRRAAGDRECRSSAGSWSSRSPRRCRSGTAPSSAAR